MLGGAAATPLAVHGPEALAPSDRTLPPLARPIEPWDTQTVIFTSGTTGPSKAVLSSYCQGWSMMGPEAWPFITGADRYFMTMPMFHVGGTGLVNCMTFRAGSLAVVPSFDTESFWPWCAAPRRRSSSCSAAWRASCGSARRVRRIATTS